MKKKEFSCELGFADMLAYLQTFFSKYDTMVFATLTFPCCISNMGCFLRIVPLKVITLKCLDSFLTEFTVPRNLFAN